MDCKKCGKIVPNKAKFCKHCGSKLFEEPKKTKKPKSISKKTSKKSVKKFSSRKTDNTEKKLIKDLIKKHEADIVKEIQKRLKKQGKKAMSDNIAKELIEKEIKKKIDKEMFKDVYRDFDHEFSYKAPCLHDWEKDFEWGDNTEYRCTYCGKKKTVYHDDYDYGSSFGKKSLLDDKAIVIGKNPKPRSFWDDLVNNPVQFEEQTNIFKSGKNKILIGKNPQPRSLWDDVIGNPTKYQELKEVNIVDRPKSACFIATAAYGTPFAHEIDILRSWRDNTLNRNIFGKTFVKVYYKISPPIADYIRNKNRIRKMVRKILKPLVNYLKNKNGLL